MGKKKIEKEMAGRQLDYINQLDYDNSSPIERSPYYQTYLQSTQQRIPQECSPYAQAYFGAYEAKGEADFGLAPPYQAQRAGSTPYLAAYEQAYNAPAQTPYLDAYKQAYNAPAQTPYLDAYEQAYNAPAQAPYLDAYEQAYNAPAQAPYLDAYFQAVDTPPQPSCLQDCAQVYNAPASFPSLGAKVNLGGIKTRQDTQQETPHFFIYREEAVCVHKQRFGVLLVLALLSLAGIALAFLNKLIPALNLGLDIIDFSNFNISEMHLYILLVLYIAIMLINFLLTIGSKGGGLLSVLACMTLLLALTFSIIQLDALFNFDLNKTLAEYGLLAMVALPLLMLIISPFSVKKCKS